MKTCVLLPVNVATDRYGNHLVVQAKFAGYAEYRHTRWLFLYDFADWTEILKSFCTYHQVEDLNVQFNWTLDRDLQNLLAEISTHVLSTELPF